MINQMDKAYHIWYKTGDWRGDWRFVSLVNGVEIKKVTGVPVLGSCIYLYSPSHPLDDSKRVELYSSTSESDCDEQMNKLGEFLKRTGRLYECG